MIWILMNPWVPKVRHLTMHMPFGSDDVIQVKTLHVTF
jgi:hypothetical protein